MFCVPLVENVCKLKDIVTKAELIKKISAQTGIENRDVCETLEAFFRTVSLSMSDGENIYIRGFGSFVNKKRARKIARNISKNTAIIVEEHYRPTFKPAKVFAEQVRKNFGSH